MKTYLNVMRIRREESRYFRRRRAAQRIGIAIVQHEISYCRMKILEIFRLRTTPPPRKRRSGLKRRSRPFLSATTGSLLRAEQKHEQTVEKSEMEQLSTLHGTLNTIQLRRGTTHEHEK